ncbi:MAG TPA: hypothetical protein VHA77_15070 [Xanthobacteraceae bacterium]|jgi:hypothetical protein|nr:hypothetical protein [Xanthobacteraceae bacterium]
MPIYSSQTNYAGRRPMESSVQASSRMSDFASRRPPGFRDDQIVRDAPRPRRRIFRRFVHFLIAIFLGVGATLGWQSYGDQAAQMVGIWSPELARLIPIPTSKPAGAASPEVIQQQIEPLTRELAALRHSVEQIASSQALFSAQQDRMAQNILAVQSSSQDLEQKLQDIGQKMSSPPPARSTRAAPRKPAEPMPLSAAR